MGFERSSNMLRKMFARADCNQCVASTVKAQSISAVQPRHTLKKNARAEEFKYYNKALSFFKNSMLYFSYKEFYLFFVSLPIQ